MILETAEARLERAPRSSGDKMAVSPSGPGWQAHLEPLSTLRALGAGGEVAAFRAKRQ